MVDLPHLRMTGRPTVQTQSKPLSTPIVHWHASDIVSRSLWKWFRTVDTDGSGAISAQELRTSVNLYYISDTYGTLMQNVL